MDSITLLIVKKFEENTNSEHVLRTIHTTQFERRKHPHTFSQLLYFKYLNVEKQSYQLKKMKNLSTKDI